VFAEPIRRPLINSTTWQYKQYDAYRSRALRAPYCDKTVFGRGWDVRRSSLKGCDGSKAHSVSPAMVESAVQVVERWIMARLRHHRFASVQSVDDDGSFRNGQIPGGSNDWIGRTPVSLCESTNGRCTLKAAVEVPLGRRAAVGR
jgi:hypothetical protein